MLRLLADMRLAFRAATVRKRVLCGDGRSSRRLTRLLTRAARNRAAGQSCVSVLLCLLLPTAAAHAGNKDTVAAYNLGNAQYKRGKYDEAAKSYEKCLALGGRSAAVYYNLGNAYFQSGDLGKAVLAYERARRLSPRDPELLENLHQAELLTRDEIEQPPRSGLGAALELGLSRVAANELVRAVSAVYLCAIVLLLVRLFAANGALRRGLGAVSLAVGLLVCVGVGAVALKLHQERSDRSAVVLTQEVDVRSGPSEHFDTVFRLHAGAVVAIHETRGVWHRVEATPKLTGWLRKDTVQRVR